MATIAGPIILGCWIIFILYWLISAMRVKVTAERQSVWSALAHRIPLGCSYILMANLALAAATEFINDAARGLGAGNGRFGLRVWIVRDALGALDAGG